MNQEIIENPEILYRYRNLGISWANTLNEITGMLWLSKAEGLNDPFDGLGYALKYNHSLKLKDDLIPLEYIWSVACFTTKWNNPTMWAHYANNYTGICLGYDKRELTNHIFEINKKVHKPSYSVKSAFLKPMEYKFNIPQIFKTMEEPLTVKTQHWKYEDEWRLGLLHVYGNISVKENGVPHLIKNALKEIIYTSHLKRNEIIAIKQIAKLTNPAIQFFKLDIVKGMRVINRDYV